MAQLINITSEALQATIRRLLPSQQGFGEDLQASNIITPIIDLTPTAEGSSVPQYLQTALSFGSQTEIDTSTDVTITTSAGFYRIVGTASTVTSAATQRGVSILLNDGSITDKIVWALQMPAGDDSLPANQDVDLTVFVRAQDSLKIGIRNFGRFAGSVRQVADGNGVLLNPNGFNPQ